MKKIKQNIIYFIFLLSLATIGACDLQETNVNPNDPTEVPAKVLLPYCESRISELTIGSNQVMSGIFTQYYLGIDNFYKSAQFYVLYETLWVNDNWGWYYDGPLVNLRAMMDVAQKDSAYHYIGIGKVLTALCLGNLTSLSGDVPYSEAIYGSLNLSPKYDAQQSLYESIQNLLDEGIVDLQKEYNGIKPASDDIIFNGDVKKWIKTAYTLKARYYLHLTKRTADLSFNPAQKALEAVNNALATSAAASLDDMEYPYDYSSTEINPFSSIIGINGILPNPTFTGLMSSLSDPRKDSIYKKEFGVASFAGGYYCSSNSPVHIATYYELMMIEAEARLRIDENDPLAQVALQNGVRSNILIVTEGGATLTVIDNYLNTNVVLAGTFDDKLKTIITQKYIALFASIESWTDFRRTGYPALTPNIGGDNTLNPGGEIPRRLIYPQNERLYNVNFPATNPTMQDRFWWDVD